ncbi:MAG: hypothetical protein ACRENZ_04725 [Thermodesulfobacteriota bacterium]
MITLDPELELTLSLIESGCLATILENKTSFIFKGDQRLIDSLKNTEKIRFDLECIKRKEFPSVVIHFYLLSKARLLYRFEYFFGIESSEETKLLKNLKEQDDFEIHFLETKIEYSKRVNINTEEKKKIGNVLEEALS